MTISRDLSEASSCQPDPLEALNRTSKEEIRPFFEAPKLSVRFVKAIIYESQVGHKREIHRFKRIFGATLRSQSLESQEREAQIAIKILNRMFDLGRPVSEAIAA